MIWLYLSWLVAFTVLFVTAERLQSATFAQYERKLAPPAGPDRNFGPQITLWQAAKWFFSFPSNPVMLFAALTAWAMKFYVGDWRWPQAVLVAGWMALWPLTEWIVHRYFEHAPPRKFFGHTWELLTCRMHRVHHRNPWDPRTGLSPPFVIVFFCTGMPLLWCLVMPFRGAILGIALTLTLLLNYEWIHFLIHTSYRPRTWLYRRLWIHHRLHHFQNEHYWYGLTMLGGDTLFKTAPTSRDVPHSETVLTLGNERQIDGWTAQGM